jgi:hypothetical protein
MDETSIDVDWYPSKPEEWEKCESKIRNLLRVYARPTEYRDGPVRVLIERMGDGWCCLVVRSGTNTCPLAFTNVVDLALRICGLQMRRETTSLAVANGRP